MQRISRFRRIATSLYQMEDAPAYVYLPDGVKRASDRDTAVDEMAAEQQMSGAELCRRGGLFVYLRYPVERFEGDLLSFVAQYHGSTTTLYLDNGSDYLQNWEIWHWSLKDAGLKTGRILSLYEYNLQVPRKTAVEVDEEGIHFQRLLFGRRGMEECREAVLSWDGQIRFMCRAGESFVEELHIRYTLDGYDEVMRKRGVVVCHTEEPRLKAGNVAKGLAAEGQTGPEDEEHRADLWVQAYICWDINKETTFDFPTNTVFCLTGYPEIEMKTCGCRFARGVTQYYLAVYGKGHFLDRADVPVGSKGFLRIGRGDRVEVVIRPEGYLGEEEKCADVSMLCIQAPFYAAGIEMESGFAVPVFPTNNNQISQLARRKLERKVQKDGIPVYHRNVWFSDGCFEACVCRQDILWYNLYGIERRFPGIALCHPRKELACALVAEEGFAVLDDRARQFFTIPYTIDKETLSRAVQMGYPPEKRELLMRCYPKGQVFLGEDSFRQGVQQADCPYTEQIERACHHFRTAVEGREVEFAPPQWEEQGILLAVKQGQTYSLREYIEDAGAWSFPSEDREASQRFLQKICEKARETVRESVVGNPGWEGSLIICAAGQEGSSWLLALEAKTGVVIWDRIQESAAPI